MGDPSKPCSKTWHSIRFGSFPTDRIAGYAPADEGSNPSPNTIFEPLAESYRQKPPGRILARIRRHDRPAFFMHT